jgi:hypothetical protein
MIDDLENLASCIRELRSVIWNDVIVPPVERLLDLFRRGTP